MLIGKSVGILLRTGESYTIYSAGEVFSKHTQTFDYLRLLK